MSLSIGQTLGRYRILEQLGQGGMATVYKAYDSRLERDVALKVIRKGAFPAEHFERVLKRFERESRALARLSHQNIVRVLDYGEQDGSPFLVLEYIPDGTLRDRLLNGPLPWEQAVRLLLPIGRALHYAHRRGVVHRDVKPSNILINRDRESLLSDFGIAKLLEGEEAATLTGTGLGLGTPEYMAPEQWTGVASPRSDIYALGVVLYEAVCGRRPYLADTPAALLLKQASEAPPRPTRFVPNLPAGLETVLMRCLARNPGDRFPTAQSLVDALEKLLGAIRPSKPIPQAEKQPLHLPRLSLPVLRIPRLDPRLVRWTLAGILLVGVLGILGVTLSRPVPAWQAAQEIDESAPFTSRLRLSTATTGRENTRTLTPLPTATRTGLPSATPTITLTATPSFPTRIWETDGAVQVLVPAGEFIMGEGERKDAPAHPVYLDSFWIDQMEVSNAMYARCVAARVCRAPRNLGSDTPKFVLRQSGIR